MGITAHTLPNADKDGWKKVKVTASGVVNKVKPGAIYGGAVMVTAGTSTTLLAYDDTTAGAGNELHPVTTTLTAGQAVGPLGGVGAVTVVSPISEGVRLDRGLYLTIGGTGSPVFWVLYK
jgi:hypothetical protein